jgi:hypothetical protein
MIPWGGGDLLSTPTSFSISKNIVNLQSNEILLNIKNIPCWKAKDWMHQKILKYFIDGVHRQNDNKSY